MKTTSLFSPIIICLISIIYFPLTVESKLLFLNPIQLIKEYIEVAALVEELESDQEESKHHIPIVRNVFLDIYNNWTNFWNNPNWNTFLAVFIDFSSYFLMPLQGGF